MSESRKSRCQAVIYKRDTHRYTGRGRSGFQMHYDKEQCSRAAKTGDLCGQHAKWEERGGGKLLRSNYGREFIEMKGALNGQHKVSDHS